MQKTLCVVDLENIKNNAAYVKKLIGDRFFYAVVKADGYGHGGVEVANALSQIADGFCVAIIDEGVALRVAGVTAPILVFAPPLDSFDVARAKEYGLTLTVNSESCARLLDGVDCEIKINTGMNRIGCAPKDTLNVLKCLKKSRVVGAYSHLFSPENDVVSTRQYDLFCGALKYVLREFPDARVHLSASGGILKGEKFLFNCVRSGILLYGYPPEGFKCAGVKPAMKVYARKVQSTEFLGGGVGYSLANRAYSRLNTYRCGYADGFLRTVPLGEGNLCMDSFISERGENLMCVMDDAKSFAKRAKTISYEVLVKACQRAERVYIR